MHSQFSEWFRSAGLPLTDDVLQKRWTAVEAFDIDRDAIVSLVEVFFGNFEDKESFLEKFRKAFQDADSAFRMRENNLELSILAGAELVDIIDRMDVESADFAALALVSCAAQNLRRTPCIAEIPEYAVKYLARRAVSRGKLTTAEKEGLDDGKIEIKQLKRDLDLLGEETNVLWWVFGETSRDTNVRWTKLGVNQTAVMAGKELADLTRLCPGPAAVPALLDRIVKYAKAKSSTQIALKDVIREIPLEWRQQFLKRNYGSALAMVNPISSCIKLSIDLAAGNAWENSLEKAVKIQKGGKISPHLLAYQVFLESMIAKIWKGL